MTDKQIANSLYELDNKCFEECPLTILIRTGLDESGKQYYDCSVLIGHDNYPGYHLADVINTSSLSEMFTELLKEWK